MYKEECTMLLRDLTGDFALIEVAKESTSSQNSRQHPVFSTRYCAGGSEVWRCFTTAVTFISTCTGLAIRANEQKKVKKAIIVCSSCICNFDRLSNGTTFRPKILEIIARPTRCSH